MKSINYFFLFLLFINSSLFAQQMRQVELPRGARTSNTVVIDGVTTHSYSSISGIPVNGIPFLTREFVPGVLELKDGKISNEVMLRYNIAKDQFEVKHASDTLTINRPHDIKFIYTDNKKFMYDPHFVSEEEGRKRNGYLEIVQEGDMSLFLKRSKKLSYDSFVSTYKGGGGTKEYYYVDRVAYFVKLKDKAPILVRSTKSFLKNIDDHKTQMRTFIKGNKLKFKNELDLVKLVNYYNSL